MDPVDIGPLELRLQPQPDEREEDGPDEADGDNEKEPGLSALKRRRSDQKAHDAEDLKRRFIINFSMSIKFFKSRITDICNFE